MTAYEEIMNALAFYFGDGKLTTSEESIYEIIGQEHDPIETIANALNAYRDSNSPVIPDGWVPCSERAPNKGQCVSITDGFLIGVWRYRGWWPDFDGNGCASTSDPQLLIKNITHWQPLPAPPKPEK